MLLKKSITKRKNISAEFHVKHMKTLQNVLLHVGTPCILVNDLLSDCFLFKRGKFPFWELSLILQQWVTLFLFARRWKNKINKWKFLYASLQSDDRIGALIKNFARNTNNYYIVGKWFPGTLVGLSKITDVISPVPLRKKRERSWAQKRFTDVKGAWDVLVSLNIEQDTAAWNELTSFDALTILIASSTNNPRLGAILLPGNTNFIHCLLFYFKFLNKVFHKQQFKFFLNAKRQSSAKQFKKINAKKNKFI